MNLSISFNDLPSAEKEVAELYAWGLTKKEIANKRNRSVRTVENQLKVIFEKTGTRKDTELTAWYFCTRFNISFDLPLIARQIIGGCFLALVGFGIFEETYFVRAKRCSKSSYARVRSAKRNEQNNAFYFS